MSASSHTRGHPFAKDQTRGVLAWLEAHGRRVVNGRRVLELEMSKVDQLVALRAAGFDVPRTIAVAGSARAGRGGPEAARPVHQQAQPGRQGPRRSAVRQPRRVRRLPGVARATRRRSTGSRCSRSTWWRPQPRITRAEIVGGEFVYAITADTARGGFQLCPADACAVGGRPRDRRSRACSRCGRASTPDHRPVRRRSPAGTGSRSPGFEFIETADGRLVTYDINTTTNYNADIEAVGAALRACAAPSAATSGELLAA